MGCPHWPGCYGHLIGVLTRAEEIARAEEKFGGSVDIGRACKKMLHRYPAGGLRLMIFAIAIIAWRGRHELGQSPFLATSLVVLITFQATLGAPGGWVSTNYAALLLVALVVLNFTLSLRSPR